jgi:predicted acylesterase/phospholipase RssA/CRP-like cAMP-binding protein
MMESNRVEQSKSGLTAYIITHDLFKGLPEPTLGDLEAELELIRLSEGEILFRQGDRGDSMCVLLSGRLGITIRNPDGIQLTADELSPGVTVGEMALITGQARVATVYALESCELVKLSKEGFERLVAKHPQVVTEFARAMMPRIQRAQLAGVLTPLFGELDTATLHDLQARMEWLHLAGGETLFRQGEPGDCMFIVVNGRLQLVRVSPDGDEYVVGEVSRGDICGEYALLTGEKRSVTVYAVRDSDVVKLSQDVFETLIEGYPQAMMRVARSVARRVPMAGPASSLKSAAVTSFALVPINHSRLISDCGRRLAEELAKYGPTLHLSSESFDRHYGKVGAAQTEPGDPTDTSLLAWISEQERKYRYLIYEADPTWSAWTQRCARQADRLLLVGEAGGDPTPGEIEVAIRGLASKARQELVLLHSPGTERPTGTGSWLAQRAVHMHHHLRVNDEAHFQRLARRLAGRTVGLVLSGGAARALAHLGVFRALDEAAIEVDIVGGASMGSVAAAAFAMDWDLDHMLKLVQKLSSRRALLDYTYPAAALFATRKITNILLDFFDDVQIEDLWRSFFCVSANLSQASLVVHQNGSLWKGVRASIAIPGVFAPLNHEGDLLVDGGVMNNLPVDVMRDLCEGGLVIAVNATPRQEKRRAWDFGPSISGWQVLWSRLNPFVKPMKVPSLTNTLVRALDLNSAYRIHSTQHLADLLIEPQTSQFGIMEWSSYEQLIEAGYQAAKQQIEIWQAKRLSPLVAS